ncbi:MAG: [FeFe] hydrogenase H-cluster maturation GTPase HydF [Ruminococcaceae bacterium]|nr:[FeFe] hydrogenase H-cluster maturation GTPase HydF [Oscillospiraceae bacterium]
MSLNETASGERLHIGFFGMRNAGKSSVVNAVTGQELSVVSDVLGTTTDPVKKAMELLPLGPVMIIDTPGIDDEGSLGEMRVAKAKRVLATCDVGILVVDSTVGMRDSDLELKAHMEKRGVPCLTVFNKADLLDKVPAEGADFIYISARDNEGINRLREKIGELSKKEENERRVVADLLSTCDHVVLVVPIDKAAPKGRLILPQQQTIRDILDAGCTATVCRDTELEETLNSFKEPPKMVICDSQVFGKVSRIVPKSILLTSFSILFARYKGDLRSAVQGAAMLSRLKDGDRVLISEGCTHHRQCGDIGSVKLPGWIRQFMGVSPVFEFTSGNTFPDDVSDYALIIHCGGCMLTEKEMRYRSRVAQDTGVPMTNYGTAIAALHGILKRSLSPFPDIQNELD